MEGFYRPVICVYNISKDEAKNAQRWARSAAAADYRVVLDTGSTDDTIALLRAEGVTVHEWPDQPFRYDAARNASLALVPDDVDLCVSLDLDEQLGEGFIDQLRLEWQVHGGFDRGLPWIYTHGGWSRTQRVHARHGYRWVSPCHEVHVFAGPGPERVIECAGTITHHQDPSKDRSFRIDLLKLAVEEAPSDARAWWYLARDSLGAGLPDTALNAVRAMLALPTGWTAERAAACRVAAAVEPDHASMWLNRGVQEGPQEAEAWYALAKHCYDEQDWPACFAAAVKGVACPAATHYLTEQNQRAWGLADLAAIAAHNLGNRDDAVTYGEIAVQANPEDGRLLTNLIWYRNPSGPASTVPTVAVIPQKAGERQEMTDRLREALEAQGASVIVDDSDDPLHHKWNKGLTEAQGGGPCNVLVLNNDIEIEPNFVAIMGASLRAADDIGMVCVAGVGLMTGWCYALRGEDGYRIDEDFSWWFGDTDLYHQVLKDGKRIAYAAVSVNHMSPNESTFSSPEKMALAYADEQKFRSKWPDADPGWFYFERNPHMVPAGQPDESVGAV